MPAAERFKGNSEDKPGLVGWISGDGIRWKKVQEAPIVPRSLVNHFDSQNVMFWSDVEQCYVLYARHSEGKRRAQAKATSKDFIHWTAMTLMTYSDTGTTIPSQHLYTNQTHPYYRAPHLYIALPGRFQSGRGVLTEAAGRQPWTQVRRRRSARHRRWRPDDLASRDRHLRFHFPRRASSGRGSATPTGHRATITRPMGVVETGPNEMSLYVQRNYGQQQSYLERLALRLDGFASVNAPYQGGEMITRPFRFTGNRLEINYSTSAAGGIRVEIQDAGGAAIPGFSLADCPEIIGDEIERIVRWKGSENLGALAGKTIRLRFVMKDADLYALRFQP